MDSTAGNTGDEGFLFPELAAVVVDLGGTVRGWSEEAAHLLGRTSGDVCGRPFRDLLAEAAEERRPTAARQPGVPVTGRTRMRRGTGEELEVDLWVTRLALAGGHDHLVLAAPSQDLAQWGRAASFLRAFLTQGDLGLGLHDTDLAVVQTNIPEMFGGPALVPGDRIARVTHAEDAKQVEALLRRVMATGTPLVAHKQRIRPRHAPERPWTFSLTAFRLQNAHGELIGVADIVRDITESERLIGHRDALHESATRIGMSLDIAGTAQALADLAVGQLADLVTVDLAEPVLVGDEPVPLIGGGEPHLVRVATASVSGEWPEEMLRAGDRYPFLPDSPELRRLQQGQTVLLNRQAMVRALAAEPLTRLLVPKGMHSAITAPLFARGLLLGSVTAWRTDIPDPFDEADAELLSEIGSRAALAVDNARRYTREHRAAVTLQERLLPRATTDSDAVQTAGVYRPASGGTGVSGDWFDAISLPSLRVGLVVGDVIGHGLSASATMGSLRTAIRTFADLELDPVEVLSRMEDLVQRLAAESPAGRRDVVGATCLYAVYDATTCQCTLACAGQPPPVVIQPDGTTRLVEVDPGVPLGVGGVPFESTTIDVEPGSVLVLYTDGLFRVERYADDSGPRRFQDDLAAQYRPGRPLEEMGQALLVDTTGRPPRDDIALMLARTRAAPDASVTSWDFPAELDSVARARDVTARQLSRWGLEELAFTTELVVSELVTNAVRYADGPVGLRLIRGHVLTCEVADPSNTQPRLLRAADTDEGGRGLYIVSQCTSRWGCRYRQQGKTIWTEQPLGDTGALFG